jgi:hypothetical protein
MNEQDDPASDRVARSMNSASASRSPFYLVGYCHPPVATRFKPGQSGNPKGRPRNAPNVTALLRSALIKKVTVTEGNHVRRISKLQALVEVPVNKAIKGDSRSWISPLVAIEGAIGRHHGLDDQGYRFL